MALTEHSIKHLLYSMLLLLMLLMLLVLYYHSCQSPLITLDTFFAPWSPMDPFNWTRNWKSTLWMGGVRGQLCHHEQAVRSSKGHDLYPRKWPLTGHAQWAAFGRARPAGVLLMQTPSSFHQPPSSDKSVLRKQPGPHTSIADSFIV